MAQTEQINELAAALSKAQGQMTAAAKDVENTFFKSKYADLSSIVEAARKPLSDNGLSVVQRTDFDDGRTFIETILMHASGQWISARYPVNPLKNDMQGLGSAVTYARRYSYAALVGVVTEDDDGNAASGNDSRAKSPHPSQARPVAPKLAPPSPPRPTAPPTELTPAQERALDRQAVAEATGTAEPLPEHDAETGEVGPRALPLGKTSKGQPNFVGWGTQLVQAFMASSEPDELSAWLQENEDTLNTCETASPKCYASIIGAYSKRSAQLTGKETVVA